MYQDCFCLALVTGEFASNECVRLLVQDEEEGSEPREFGRAIVNYDGKDCQKLNGRDMCTSFHFHKCSLRTSAQLNFSRCVALKSTHFLSPLSPLCYPHLRHFHSITSKMRLS